ncbi:hypothetical protein ACFQRK_15025 [Parapedobacter sp. GCM10030251]|jgi:hypothetical protein|uniref:hypothetical protein n=1 Tax=Parapedobacter sp. GCM10030251 TaxID=3273419 RepID=UPI003616A131
MFNVNSSFYQFLTALQDKLDTEFDLRALSETACLLSATNKTPVHIIYYLSDSDKRIQLDVDARCIHIDEDLWINRPVLLLNRIASLAGKARRIHARDTVAARIDKSVAMAFQQENHLQVALPGKYRYGLFHSGDLVAIAVFSGGRKMNNQPDNYRSFELLRFCHKQGIQVVGGFSKLIDAFQQEFHPGDIMTYADKDWSDGDSYRKIGFMIVGQTEPQQFWINTHTKQRYDEHTLPEEIKNASLPMRKKLGYTPIYNSGSIKLVKVL